MRRQRPNLSLAAIAADDIPASSACLRVTIPAWSRVSAPRLGGITSPISMSMAADTDNPTSCRPPRPSGHVITKDFYAYKRIILRQDKRLRDHGGGRGRNGE